MKTQSTHCEWCIRLVRQVENSVDPVSTPANETMGVGLVAAI